MRSAHRAVAIVGDLKCETLAHCCGQLANPSSWFLLLASFELVKREAIRLRCAKKGFECGSTHNYPNLLRNVFAFYIEFQIDIPLRLLQLAPRLHGFPNVTSKDAFVHIIYIIGSVAGGLASSFRAASDHHRPQLTGRRVTNDLARCSTRIQLELWAAGLLCSALCELMADSCSSSSGSSIVNNSDNFAENHLKVCKHFDNLPTFTSPFPCQRTVYEKKFSFV